MSMSEFERRQGEAENELSCSPNHEAHVPDDFSEEDLKFASELHSIFSLEEEEVPPYYVQTLLDVENPQFSTPSLDLETRTRARVFRRLNIQRRLFHPQEKVGHPIADFFFCASIISSSYCCLCHIYDCYYAGYQ